MSLGGCDPAPAKFRYTSVVFKVIRHRHLSWSYQFFNNQRAKYLFGEQKVFATAMAAMASAELIAELEATAKDGAPERRTRILQRVANLFVSAAGRLGPDQIEVFDDVLVRLMERMDTRRLAEISAVLAEVAPAPQTAIRRLARHESPSVAIPVLLKSPSLTEADLIEIASHFSQQHLVAISSRPGLNEALTDAILKHAGKEAGRVLARNPKARFSALGYAALLILAERDDNVAESLASRSDLPADSLKKLLNRTTEVVRARLLKSASPKIRERVQAILDGATEFVVPKPAASDDYAEAKAAVVVLNKTGKLNDSSVNRFAIRREYPNVIAALSLLSGATVETIAPLMEQEDGSGLIIACRGSRLNWQTTAAVLNNRRVPPLPKEQLKHAREVFEMLYVSAAQYTIRFEPPVKKAPKSGPDNNAVAAAGGYR